MSTSISSASSISEGYCIICCHNLPHCSIHKLPRISRQAAKNNRNIFTKLCHKLRIQSLTSLPWDFEIEPLPFCKSCTDTAYTIKSLEELIEILQLKIKHLIQNVQKKVLASCEDTTENVLYGPLDSLECESMSLMKVKLKKQKDETVKHFRTQILLSFDSLQVKDVQNAKIGRNRQEVLSSAFPKAEARSKVQLTTGRSRRHIPNDKHRSSDVEAVPDDNALYNEFSGKRDDASLGINIESETVQVKIEEEDLEYNDTFYDDGLLDHHSPDNHNFPETELPSNTVGDNKTQGESDNDEMEEDMNDSSSDPDWSDGETSKRLESDERYKKKLRAQERAKAKLEHKKMNPPFFVEKPDGRLIHDTFEFSKIENGNYQCNQCPSKVGRKSLRTHVMSHDGQGYICEACGKSFAQKFLLRSHVHYCRDGKFIECTICGRPLKDIRCLRSHLWSHKSQEEKEAVYATGKRQPKKVKIDEPHDHQCRHCGKLVRKSRLKWHELSHLTCIEKPYSCNLCPKTYGTKGGLALHKRLHNPIDRNRFQCQVCTKGFTTRMQLVKHFRVHTGEEPNKPYECNVCSKRFRILSFLNAHQVSHTGEKPYACQYCSVTYSWKTSLRRHLESSHGISQSKDSTT